MPIEGTERFLRVKHSSLGHPKFIGLSAAERGTWLVAVLLGDIAHPGLVHESAVLEKCPDATFERLYERQLLEHDSRPGWFRIHDLKQEGHVAPSQAPEAVKDRVRRHRAAQKVTDVTDVTTENGRNGSNYIRDETRLDERENVLLGRVGRSARSAPTQRRGLRRVMER